MPRTRELLLSEHYQIDGASNAISDAACNIRIVGLKSETRFKTPGERRVYIADQVAKINAALVVIGDALTQVDL